VNPADDIWPELEFENAPSFRSWWKREDDPDVLYQQTEPELMTRWGHFPHLTLQYKSLEAFTPQRCPSVGEIWQTEDAPAQVVRFIQERADRAYQPMNPYVIVTMKGDLEEKRFLLPLFLRAWRPLEKIAWEHLDK